jgi:hypothetical protein
MLCSKSFTRIGSNMPHSYTLERCVSFPTNVIGLIACVTLPMCEAYYQVSPSHAELYLTMYSTLCIDPVNDRESNAIHAETLKLSPCSTRWGGYGLPPVVVPRGNIARPSHLNICRTKKKLLACSSHSKICVQCGLSLGVTDYLCY